MGLKGNPMLTTHQKELLDAAQAILLAHDSQMVSKNDWRRLYRAVRCVRNEDRMHTANAMKVAAEYRSPLEYGPHQQYDVRPQRFENADGSTEIAYLSDDAMNAGQTGECPLCGKQGPLEEGCPTCPGCWYATPPQTKRGI